MKKLVLFTLIGLSILTLTSCNSAASLYNFEPRQDSTLFSEDRLVMIEYETDIQGKLTSINIDRLLTIEEMVLFNPTIDTDYQIEGFTGDIFVEPSNSCTDVSNDVLVPVNIEVGNTRYKYDDDDCMYKTVDNYNEYRPGYADEYLLSDTIPVPSHIKISIIVYNPTELVNFIEIYDLPNTYEKIGLYNILLNRDRNGFENNLINYSRDMSVLEQLYLKHQELEGATNEVLGIASDINILDLDNLDEIIPLIDNLERNYEAELQALEELQQEIGIAFETETDAIDGNTDEEDEPADTGE
jgi:hypothetical protein